MADALLIHIFIEVLVNIFLIAREVKEELLEGGLVIFRIVHHRIDLAAVAGGEHHQFLEPIIL